MAATLVAFPVFRYFVRSATNFERTAATYSREAFAFHFARAFSSRIETNASSFDLRTAEIFGTEVCRFSELDEAEEAFHDDEAFVSATVAISISTVVEDFDFPSELTDSMTYWYVPVLNTRGYHFPESQKKLHFPESSELVDTPSESEPFRYMRICERAFADHARVNECPSVAKTFPFENFAHVTEPTLTVPFDEAVPAVPFDELVPEVPHACPPGVVDGASELWYFFFRYATASA